MDTIHQSDSMTPFIKVSGDAVADDGAQKIRRLTRMFSCDRRSGGWICKHRLQDDCFSVNGNAVIPDTVFCPDTSSSSCSTPILCTRKNY